MIAKQKNYLAEKKTLFEICVIFVFTWPYGQSLYRQSHPFTPYDYHSLMLIKVFIMN